MKIITEEQVISCLFGMGFDVIDQFLIYFTLERLLDDNKEISRCQYTTDFSEFFRTYVTSDDGDFTYKSSKLRIKNPYSLLANIRSEKEPLLLAEAFASQNPELMELVRKIDFREVVIKKIDRLSWSFDFESFPIQFCEKEKAILREVFGFEQITMEHQKESIEVNKVLAKK